MLKQTKPSSRPKSLYRVKNWSAYEKALVQRGSIAFWLSGDFKQTWLYTGIKQRGSQFDYSDNVYFISSVVSSLEIWIASRSIRRAMRTEMLSGPPRRSANFVSFTTDSVAPSQLIELQKTIQNKRVGVLAIFGSGLRSRIPNTYYQSSLFEYPLGPSNIERQTLRGGSWYLKSDFIRGKLICSLTDPESI